MAKSSNTSKAEVALLWGDLREESLNGSFVRLSAGYSGSLSNLSGMLRSVVVRGDLEHSVPDATETSVIGPGGFFESSAGLDHRVSCRADVACVIYVRTRGKFRIR